MSVYVPGHVKGGHYHFDFWFHGRRFRGSTGCTRKEDAERFEKAKRREVEAAFIRRPAGSAEPLTWAEASSLYWTEIGQHHANAGTTLWSLDWLTAEIGKTTLLTAITPARVQQLVAKRRGETTPGGARVQPATVNRTVTEPLRKVLLHAARTHAQALPPIEWRKYLLKEPRERVRELRADEEAALFAVLREDYAAPVRFALLTGCRLAEIAGLTWDDVDFGNRRIWITGKGGKRASVPMPPSVRAVLWAERGRHPVAVFTYAVRRPGLVGPRARRGDRAPITREGMKITVRRAIAAAGLSGFRFHDLRHTAATRVLRATGNLRTVQTLLRHDRVETTTKYAHVTDDDVMQAMEAAAAPAAPSRGKDSANG